jgi:hypothetical protein
MWSRVAAGVAIGVTLVACRQVAPSPSLVGLGNLALVRSSVVDSADGSPGSPSGENVTYVIVEGVLKNTTMTSFTPDPGHFVLTDSQGMRSTGLVSGSAALVGLGASLAPIAPGEAQKVTVAFRALRALRSGTVAYEP